jgi:polyisoprenyl-phosphate glycosyltransferase
MDRPPPDWPRLSAVVPCHNEQDGLVALYRRLSEACASCVGESYEIIIVDDGSLDRSWKIIDILAKDDPHVIGVSLSRNFGHQLALTAGLSFARGDRSFVIDADLCAMPLAMATVQAMDGHRGETALAEEALALARQSPSSAIHMGYGDNQSSYMAS